MHPSNAARCEAVGILGTAPQPPVSVRAYNTPGSSLPRGSFKHVIFMGLPRIVEQSRTPLLILICGYSSDRQRDMQLS